MPGRLLLSLLLASVLATSEVLSHDLLYKPIRRPLFDDELPDTIPIFKKIPAIKRSQPLQLPTLKSSTSHSNRCSNEESKCSLSTGQEGCCPYKNGTCCVDKLTCCPFGHQCNIKDGTCIVKQDKEVNAVVCPDGQSQCPDGSTCCKLQSGQYGCCPLEKATCCRDGVHCCPNGYKCDVSAGTCSKSGSIASRVKLSSCCTFFSGSVLCCKNGLVCDPKTYQCMAPVSEVDQVATTEPVHSADYPSQSVGSAHLSMFGAQRRLVACAAGLNCGSKSTCCITDSGSPKCCSHSDGVCCSGGSHCCPRGFACAANGKCAIGAGLSQP
ncbi:hypothetical protein BOX15_Mlig015434g1 [Macrostomum lignano]|uniref:Granulins domain-containing protein n=1 Tax=Macrostomum lignano TaxID=282301 RepID=A0A267DRZ2_9PLAT|nr:hypothetical protein BOX15_Mlig015434g1 [Macrostomum lignano]